jgi:hypothetical protein
LEGSTGWDNCTDIVLPLPFFEIIISCSELGAVRFISLGPIFQRVLLVQGQTREICWFANFVCLHVEANGKLEKVSLCSRFETDFTFSFPSKLAKQVINTRRWHILGPPKINIDEYQ